MRSLSKILFISAAIFYLPIQAKAWGMLGHRIVGEIAESYIDRNTKKEIQKILGTESLSMASNWADFVKSDSSFNYLSNWHYANFMDNLDYEMLKVELEKQTGNNIYNRIKFLGSELKKKDLELTKKRMYLRLLIHFVGDIHQPLHVGRKEDSGGNNIKLSWFNQPSNLHRLWDSDLIESQQLSYTEYAKAVNFPTKIELKTWLSDDLTVWTYEGYVLSRKIYDTVKPEQKLGYRYNYDHLATVNNQLLKGGVRLAGLLNRIFSGN